MIAIWALKKISKQKSVKQKETHPVNEQLLERDGLLNG